MIAAIRASGWILGASLLAGCAGGPAPAPSPSVNVAADEARAMVRLALGAVLGTDVCTGKVPCRVLVVDPFIRRGHSIDPPDPRAPVLGRLAREDIAAPPATQVTLGTFPAFHQRSPSDTTWLWLTISDERAPPGSDGAVNILVENDSEMSDLFIEVFVRRTATSWTITRIRMTQG